MKNNIRGYQILIEIEIVMREYIISQFDLAYKNINWIDRDGPLGPDKDSQCSLCKKNSKSLSIPQKIDIQREYYINKGWDRDNAITTHGLYFLLFTDLPDFFNWDLKNKFILNGESINVFKDLNKNKIDSLCNHLVPIYPIRNKIAHSCLISDLELSALETLKAFLKQFFKNFDDLLLQPEKRNSAIIDYKKAISILVKKMLTIDADIENEIKEYFKIANQYPDFNFDFIKFEFILNSYIALNKQTGSFTKIKDLVQKNNEYLISLK